MTERDSPEAEGWSSGGDFARVADNETTTSWPHGTESSYAAASSKGRACARRDADDGLAEVRTPPASPRYPGTGGQRRTPHGLPIPALRDGAREAGIYCVITPADRDGRLAARSALTFLGWSAGQAVELAIGPGPIVVARTGRDVRVNPRGHLRLPLAVRRRCRIATGDRVLLVANQQRGELLVIPMAVLDDMVAVRRQAHDSGAGR